MHTFDVKQLKSYILASTSIERLSEVSSVVQKNSRVDSAKPACGDVDVSLMRVKAYYWNILAYILQMQRVILSLEERVEEIEKMMHIDLPFKRLRSEL